MNQVSEQTHRVESLYTRIGKLGWLYDLWLRLFGYTKAVEYFVRKLREETGEKVERVLDAGCGTGPYTLAVLKQFPNAHVTAFDYQESMAERARANVERAGFAGRVQLFAADVTGPLPHLAGQFDLVIVSGVLEYVPMQETVKNLSRCLKPGGYFFHSPVTDSLYGEVVGKLYHFTPRSQPETIQAFTSQGYELKKIVKLPAFVPASFKEAHIFRKV